MLPNLSRSSCKPRKGRGRRLRVYSHLGKRTRPVRAEAADIKINKKRIGPDHFALSTEHTAWKKSHLTAMDLFAEIRVKQLIDWDVMPQALKYDQSAMRA